MRVLWLSRAFGVNNAHPLTENSHGSSDDLLGDGDKTGTIPAGATVELKCGERCRVTGQDSRWVWIKRPDGICAKVDARTIKAIVERDECT